MKVWCGREDRRRGILGPKGSRVVPAASSERPGGRAERRQAVLRRRACVGATCSRAPPTPAHFQGFVPHIRVVSRPQEPRRPPRSFLKAENGASGRAAAAAPGRQRPRQGGVTVAAHSPRQGEPGPRPGLRRSALCGVLPAALRFLRAVQRVPHFPARATRTRGQTRPSCSSPAPRVRPGTRLQTAHGAAPRPAARRHPLLS